MVNKVSLNGLIFLEDPGALNVILPIIKTFSENNLSFDLTTSTKTSLLFKDSKIFNQTVRHINPNKLSKYLKEINNHKFDFFLFGTSENRESMSFLLRDYFHEINVQTISVIDSPANLNKRFCGKTKNIFNHAPDKLIVFDKDIKDALKSLNFLGEIFVFNNPVYENIINQSKTIQAGENSNLRKQLNISKDARVITFASEIDASLDEGKLIHDKSYSFHSNLSKLRSEVIADNLIKACKEFDNEIFTIYRRHPKQFNRSTSLLEKEFDYISENDNLADLFSITDIFYGMTSFILEQSFLNGIKTFALIPRELELSWLNLLKKGMIPSIRTFEGILESLSSSKIHEKNDYNKIINSELSITRFEDLNNIISYK